MSRTILHVALPTPLYTHLDYLLPDDLVAQAPQIGCRVRVPFRQQQLIRVIIAIDNKSTLDHQRLRNIIELVDSCYNAGCFISLSGCKTNTN